MNTYVFTGSIQRTKHLVYNAHYDIYKHTYVHVIIEEKNSLKEMRTDRSITTYK